MEEDIKWPDRTTAEEMLKRKRKYSGDELGRLFLDNVFIISQMQSGSPAELHKTDKLIDYEEIWKVLRTLPTFDQAVFSKYERIWDFFTIACMQALLTVKNIIISISEYSKYVHHALQVETLCRGLRQTNCDDTGLFRLPDTTLGFAFLPTFSKIEPSEESKKEVVYIRNTIINEYIRTLGFNIIIDLISECFKLKYAYYMKAKLFDINILYDTLNLQIKELHNLINENLKAGWRPELQAYKLKMQQRYFSQIKYKSLKIPPNNIPLVKSMIKDFSAFNNVISGLGTMLSILTKDTKWN